MEENTAEREATLSLQLERVNIEDRLSFSDASLEAVPEVSVA